VIQQVVDSLNDTYGPTGMGAAAARRAVDRVIAGRAPTHDIEWTAQALLMQGGYLKARKEGMSAETKTALLGLLAVGVVFLIAYLIGVSLGNYDRVSIPDCHMSDPAVRQSCEDYLDYLDR